MSEDVVTLDQVRQMVGSDHGDTVTLDDLNRMVKLRQFMREQPTQVPGGWLGRELEGVGAGAARGLGRAGLGAAELVGEGVKAVGFPQTGGAIADKARSLNADLTAATAPDIQRAPVAGTVGEVGSYLAAPGRALATVDLGRPVVNALVQGAATGALEPTAGGDFWRQKLGQVGLGAAAGGVTHVAGNALAGIVAPQLAGPRAALFNEGVNLTPGQALGGIARRIEDKATSLPLVGDAIQNARAKGIESFDRAAINRTLAPIGEALPAPLKAGRTAIDFAHERLSDAYDKLLPHLKGALDPELQQDIGAVEGLGGNLPEAQQRQLNSIIKNEITDRFTSGGVTSGRSLKDIESELGRIARENGRSSDYDVRRLGTAVQELQASVRRMVERQNPAQQGALSKINEGWANLLRVERAAGSAGAQGGVFTPAQLANAAKAFDSSRNKSGFARGNALMQDLTDAGKSVLPSTVPNSGTTDRLLLSALMGGGGLEAYLGNPLPLVAAGAAALPYTSPGMALVRNYLAGAPQARGAVASVLRRIGSAAVPGSALLATQGTAP